jgi:hypothetical protein
MAITNLGNVPILAVALDNFPKFYEDAISGIADGAAEISGEHVASAFNKVNQALLSDVLVNSNRVYIPITDRLLPINMTGAHSGNSNNVTYDSLDLPVFAKGRDSYTITFEVGKALTRFSSMINILQSIAGRTSSSLKLETLGGNGAAKDSGGDESVRFNDVPRIGFFSSELVFVNGYLRSIQR